MKKHTHFLSSYVFTVALIGTIGTVFWGAAKLKMWSIWFLIIAIFPGLLLSCFLSLIQQLLVKAIYKYHSTPYVVRKSLEEEPVYDYRSFFYILIPASLLLIYLFVFCSPAGFSIPTFSLSPFEAEEVIAAFALLLLGPPIGYMCKQACFLHQEEKRRVVQEKQIAAEAEEARRQKEEEENKKNTFTLAMERLENLGEASPPLQAQPASLSAKVNTDTIHSLHTLPTSMLGLIGEFADFIPPATGQDVEARARYKTQVGNISVVHKKMQQAARSPFFEEHEAGYKKEVSSECLKQPSI